jgi:small membrane protein
MNLAAASLLVLVLGLVAFDWVTLRGKNRRALLLELAAFLVGAFFIAFPERATDLAHFVGIGRGVDFLLYPLVIWLVRESLLTRRLRQEDGERMTQMARAIAIAGAARVGLDGPDHSTGLAPAQSAASSASTTT